MVSFVTNYLPPLVSSYLRHRLPRRNHPSISPYLAARRA